VQISILRLVQHQGLMHLFSFLLGLLGLLFLLSLCQFCCSVTRPPTWVLGQHLLILLSTDMNEGY
jgi:hypothetical protein